MICARKSGTSCVRLVVPNGPDASRVCNTLCFEGAPYAQAYLVCPFAVLVPLPIVAASWPIWPPRTCGTGWCRFARLVGHVVLAPH